MTDLLPDLSRVDRIALDTETSGLDFTSRPVGLSWATPDGRKRYARWGHECGGNNVDVEQVRRWLREELDRSDLTVYMHNAAFDLRMLAYRGPGDHGIPGVGVILERARVEDTGFMAALHDELQRDYSLDGLGQRYCDLSKQGDKLWEWCAETFGGRPTRKGQSKNIWRAPGGIVEEYAEFDAYNTLALADTLRPLITEEGLDEVYDLETRLIPLLLQMHLVGVRVDLERAEELQAELVGKQQDLQRRWDRLVGEDVNWGSTKQLVEVFEKHDLSYNLTEKGNPSITADVLESQGEHPVCGLILQLKKLKHYAGTFIQSYVIDNADADGVIHGEFHPLRNNRYGTVSGRFSSGGGLNLQNVPARDPEWAPLIRGLFVPYYEGGLWNKNDLSQIEFRYLAHYGGGQIQEAYVTDPGVDFHQACADLVGIPRKPAKNINFGLVYGMGVALMAKTLGVPVDEAHELLEEYHRRLPEVRSLYRKASRRAASRGYIITWGGRKRRFKKTGRGYKNTHVALNALLQGSAADLIKRAMLSVAEIIDWERTPLHLTVHDELDFTVPPGEEGLRFVRQVKERMEDFNLRVPVIADCELGADWGHVEEIAL